MKKDGQHIQFKRMLASILILILLFGALQVVTGSFKNSSANNLQEVSQRKINSYIEEDGTFKENEAAKDLLNIPDASNKSQVPPEFNAELLDLSNKAEIRINSEKDVFSFVDNCNAEEAFKNAKLELETKGWTYIESNSNLMATFIKEGGKYQWTCVSSIQEGSQSVIVIQVIGG